MGKPTSKGEDKTVELAPGLKRDLAALAHRESYDRHCRLGRQALPAFEEDLEGLQSCGIPVEMKQHGSEGAVIPVTPWGWHVYPQAC